MSIHKLTAGSGYTYLTRQVAAVDATSIGGSGLADYYSAKGESPGVWVGAGVASLGGLGVGEEVTAEHMASLYGLGEHPLARSLIESAAAQGLPSREVAKAGRLGNPFKVYSDDIPEFRAELARRVEELNRSRGLPGGARITAEDRAALSSEVGRDLFRVRHGRNPVDARELSAAIAKASRPRTTAVAGYDLTFSPVKSVSALWAVAPMGVARLIEEAQPSTAAALHRHSRAEAPDKSSARCAGKAAATAAPGSTSYSPRPTRRDGFASVAVRPLLSSCVIWLRRSRPVCW